MRTPLVTERPWAFSSYLGRFWRGDLLGAFDLGLLKAEPSGQPVLVYANHGRWVADCPACPSAARVRSDDPSFVCVECGEGPRPLEWPSDRPQIEAVLAARKPQHRNWVPGETVAMLEDDNRAHGLAA